MKVLSGLVIVAALTAFMPVIALAQNAIFTDNDGTFTFDTKSGDPTQNELALGTISNGLGTPSQLTAISGLSGAPYGISNTAIAFPCSPCLGTVTLNTGPLMSGSVTSTNPALAAQFSPGGTFMASYTNLGPGEAVSFTGSFSSASWTSAGVGSNTWNFFGRIVGGILTVNGTSYMVPTAVTVQLTTVGSAPVFHTNKGTYTFSDSGGTTNFSVAPEPGTLTLFGSGLIAVGFFTRRKLVKKAAAAKNSISA